MKKHDEIDMSVDDKSSIWHWQSPFFASLSNYVGGHQQEDAVQEEDAAVVAEQVADDELDSYIVVDDELDSYITDIEAVLPTAREELNAGNIINSTITEESIDAIEALLENTTTIRDMMRIKAHFVKPEALRRAEALVTSSSGCVKAYSEECFTDEAQELFRRASEVAIARINEWIKTGVFQNFMSALVNDSEEHPLLDTQRTQDFFNLDSLKMRMVAWTDSDRAPGTISGESITDIAVEIVHKEGLELLLAEAVANLNVRGINSTSIQLLLDRVWDSHPVVELREDMACQLVDLMKELADGIIEAVKYSESRSCYMDISDVSVFKDVDPKELFSHASLRVNTLLIPCPSGKTTQLDFNVNAYGRKSLFFVMVGDQMSAKFVSGSGILLLEKDDCDQLISIKPQEDSIRLAPGAAEALRERLSDGAEAATPDDKRTITIIEIPLHDTRYPAQKYARNRSSSYGGYGYSSYADDEGGYVAMGAGGGQLISAGGAGWQDDFYSTRYGEEEDDCMRDFAVEAHAEGGVVLSSKYDGSGELTSKELGYLRARSDLHPNITQFKLVAVDSAQNLSEELVTEVAKDIVLSYCGPALAGIAESFTGLFLSRDAARQMAVEAGLIPSSEVGSEEEDAVGSSCGGGE